MTTVNLLAAGAVALVLFIALDRLAQSVTRPKLKPVTLGADELDLPSEELVIRSGAIDLHALLFSAPGSDGTGPLFILAHGWTANHSTLVALAEPLVRSGSDVLLFDVRGHGWSTPVPYVTIRDFRDDLMAVTRYAAERFPDRPVVVVGHSMGGSAAVVAAADGSPVDALVLIATPADVIRVTAEYLDDHGLPGDLMMTVLRPFLWRRVGSSFRPLSAERRIRELELPILLIQPEHDARVVGAHAKRLADASGLEVHLIRDREHTDVLTAPRTLSLIHDFVEGLASD